jgi:hypothetical protein
VANLIAANKIGENSQAIWKRVFSYQFLVRSFGGGEEEKDNAEKLDAFRLKPHAVGGSFVLGP